MHANDCNFLSQNLLPFPLIWKLKAATVMFYLMDNEWLVSVCDFKGLKFLREGDDLRKTKALKTELVQFFAVHQKENRCIRYWNGTNKSSATQKLYKYPMIYNFRSTYLVTVF